MADLFNFYQYQGSGFKDQNFVIYDCSQNILWDHPYLPTTNPYYNQFENFYIPPNNIIGKRFKYVLGEDDLRNFFTSKIKLNGKVINGNNDRTSFTTSLKGEVYKSYVDSGYFTSNFSGQYNSGLNDLNQFQSRFSGVILNGANDVGLFQSSFNGAVLNPDYEICQNKTRLYGRSQDIHRDTGIFKAEIYGSFYKANKDQAMIDFDFLEIDYIQSSVRYIIESSDIGNIDFYFAGISYNKKT